MTIQYALCMDDYVQGHLYTASKNKRIKRQQKRSWLVLSLILLVTGAVSWQKEDKFLSYYLLTMGVLSLILIPYYQKYKYKKHFIRLAKEHYQTYEGKTTEVTIEDDVILTKDFSGESKFYLTELAEINEIFDYIFIKMKNTQSLIIAKQQVTNLTDLTALLKRIAKAKNVNYNIELDWKWK